MLLLCYPIRSCDDLFLLPLPLPSVDFSLVRGSILASILISLLLVGMSSKERAHWIRWDLDQIYAPPPTHQIEMSSSWGWGGVVADGAAIISQAWIHPSSPTTCRWARCTMTRSQPYLAWEPVRTPANREILRARWMQSLMFLPRRCIHVYAHRTFSLPSIVIFRVGPGTPARVYVPAYLYRIAEPGRVRDRT